MQELTSNHAAAPPDLPDLLKPLKTCLDALTTRGVTEIERRTAQDYIAAVHDRFKPAKPEWLLWQIHVLMRFYYQDDTDPATEEAVARSWADDLGSYPDWAIADAIRQWRRNKRTRPTPADLLSLCGEALHHHEQNRTAAVAIAKAPTVEAARASQRDHESGRMNPSVQKLLSETYAHLRARTDEFTKSRSEAHG